VKNFIRSKRKILGISQTELSLKAGISRTALVAIEKGLTKPKGETMLKLARVLNCNVESLFIQDK
jgi:DNA-binding XRE family transcriptional regulator